jgi:hypothetical protein
MTCTHKNTSYDENVNENFCSDCNEWQTDKKISKEIKYYKYNILQRIGGYEDITCGLVCFPISADLECEGYRMAKEWRGSTSDDYDQDMDAYWFDGQGVVSPADFTELDKETFDIIKLHMGSL